MTSPYLLNACESDSSTSNGSYIFMGIRFCGVEQIIIVLSVQTLMTESKVTLLSIHLSTNKIIQSITDIYYLVCCILKLRWNSSVMMKCQSRWLIPWLHRRICHVEWHSSALKLCSDQYTSGFIIFLSTRIKNLISR